MEHQEYLKKQQKKANNSWPINYKEGLSKTPIRVVIGIGALVVAIYGTGKFLRLLGGAVEDAKYFSKALRS